MRSAQVFSIEPFAGVVGENDLELAILDDLVQLGDLKVDDLEQVVVGQLVKDYDLVETVDELGLERSA